MELTKIILLFCLISFSLCHSEDSSETELRRSRPKSRQHALKPSQVQKYGTFEGYNSLTNNPQQCFCYLQRSTGVPITHVLNTGGDTLERIVVYLYKDPKSNNIKLYLPNTEKQIMIPDLLFDEGDRLAIPSGNIKTFFNLYPDLNTERKIIKSSGSANILLPGNIDNLDIPDILDIKDPKNTKVYNNEGDQVHPIKYIKIPNHNIEHHDLEPNIKPDGHNIFIDVQTEEPIHSIHDHVITESETARPNINLDLRPENINYIEDDQPKGLEMDHIPESLEEIEEHNIVEDEPEKSYIHMVPDKKHRFNNIAEIVTEHPQIVEESTNKPENNKFPDINEEIHELTPEKHTHSIHGSIPELVNNNKGRKIPDNMFLNVNENSYEPPNIEWEDNIDLNKGEQKLEPHNIDDQYGPGVEKQKNHHVTWPKFPIPDTSSYNVQKPFIISRVIKGHHETRPISLDVNKYVLPERHRITIHPQEYFDKHKHEVSIITMHPKPLVDNYHKSFDLHDTFDNWFKQQMKRVEFTNSRASSLIDMNTFKRLIEKTLHNKGMHVTEKGIIIDSAGNVLQTSNLSLRPILIGNSVEYKNLLEGKLSTFKLPMDLPYLEAVLITSIEPPKILGIIPLGKTYLPKRYKKPLPVFFDADGSHIYGCGGGCNYRPKLSAPIGTHRARGRFSVPRYKTISKESNPVYTRRVFPFDQLNTLIDRLYRVPLSEEKVVTLPERYVVNPPPLIAPTPVIKYPITVTRITPGFRIIGGNAATSSGTPVTSKGRSGLDSSEDLDPTNQPVRFNLIKQ